MKVIILSNSPDKPGIAEAIAKFILEIGGNILETHQHKDLGSFISRVEFEIVDLPEEKTVEIAAAWSEISEKICLDSHIYFGEDKIKIGILVTKEDHCLRDIIWRTLRGELNVSIEFIMSNHEILKPVAVENDIPFFFTPVQPERGQEKDQVEIIRKSDVELVVMAKYMQLLTGSFIEQVVPIVNIHHSFLPGFVGPKPYHQAHARGVKIIGATAHYAISEMDEGPIIEQEVIRVSHKNPVSDLIRKGRDLEKVVLSRAIDWYAKRRLLKYQGKVAVFD